jgi:hypothetical protein
VNFLFKNRASLTGNVVMKKRMKDTLSVLLRYVLGISVIIWLFKTNQLNIDSLSLIDAATASWVVCLCAFQFILCAYRVKILLGAHQISMSLTKCLIYNAVGIYYSMILPGGMSGDAVRAYYFWRCRSNKGNPSKAAMVGSLITDRLVGTLILLLIGLIAATFSAKEIGISMNYLIVVWLLFILGIGFYFILCGTHRFEWKIAETSRFNAIGQRMQRLLATMDLTSYPREVIIGSILISIIVHLVTILAIFIFATKLKSGLGFDQVMAVAPVGLIVNALPISPGGLGVGEKSFELLFSMIGGQQGGNTFMLSRIFLFAPAIFGAFFSLIFWQGKKRPISGHNYPAVEI